MADEEAVNGFQETEAAILSGEVIESHDVNRLAMLHITSPPTTSTDVPEPTSADRCKSCGSMKRRSPSTPSPSSGELCIRKKLTLQQPSNKTHQHRRRFHGYTKLALPIPNSPGISSAVNPALATPENKMVPKSLVPTNSPATAKSTNALLPPPRPLSRSATAPSSTFDAALRHKGLVTSEDKLNSAKRLKRMKDSMREMSQWCSQVILEGEEHDGSEEINNETPQKPDDSPSVSKIDRASTAPSSTFDTLLREKDLDTSEEKLHSAKKLKRMKDHMKEMSQWGGQVIREGEEHSGFEENNHETPKDGSETETEEVPAARVDKAGDCFIIQFKCPCEKVYQLLFSESHIYYMLMSIQQNEPEKEAEEKISVERSDNWLVITTKCPCKKGYRVLLSGKVCFYQLI